MIEDSKELLSPLVFCVIDLETTGGDHKYDKIIEVGLVRIQNLKLTDEFSSLINPEIPIPEFVQKLTSIREQDLVNEPTIEQLIDKIVSFVGDAVLVAHNTSFDIPFLNSVLHRLGRPILTNPSLCTNIMTKYLIPEIMYSNLPYVAELFCIEHKQAHRALEDARVTAQLFLHYLDFFIQKKIKKINHLYYPRRKFELNTAHFKTITPIKDHFAGVRSPLMMQAKAANGRILSLLPLLNPEEELDEALTFIKTTSFERLSFKMVGHYLEALLYLAESFHHYTAEEKEKHLNYLFTFTQLSHHASKELTYDEKNKKFYIIIPHLIPEQFKIYSIDQKKLRGQLIFRYPTHQKRFNLFLTHEERAIKGNKQITMIDDALYHFLMLYLRHYKKEGTFFLFESQNLTKPQEFKRRLSLFINQREKKSLDTSYPFFHI